MKEIQEICWEVKKKTWKTKGRGSKHFPRKKNSVKLSNQGGIQPMLPVSAPSPSNDLIKLINSIHFIYPQPLLSIQIFFHPYTRITYSSHIVYLPRDETGLVCLPTQLERTLQLYW